MPRRGPARTGLGPDYHKLWTAAAISNLGDGTSAGPVVEEPEVE
jgi:hypothetical protein